ncbi:MAG: DMT family transporter [Bacteroidales bacterium]|nr:MAG: DMT family transporter [Bacteroidales bacterium]
MNLGILGIAAALTSAASWALGSILFKKIGEKVSPFGMTLTKGILGIFLLGIAYAIYGFEFVPLNAGGMLIISGVIGIAVGDTLFFAALQYLGAKVQIIFFMMGQVMTAILGLLILKEMPLLLQWIGIFVTLLGAATVLWKKIFSDSKNQKTAMRGVVFGLLAMFCFSSSLIIAKQAMITVSALSAVLIRITAGTLGILIFGLIRREVKIWLVPFQDFKMVVFFFVSVCVVTFGGFWLSLVAIKFLDIAVASTLGATEPLFVLPLALIILKERITLLEVIGAVLTVCGVIIIIIGSG